MENADITLTNSEYRMLDGAFLTHAIAWLVGAMATCVAVVTVGALFAMGRSGYRKD